MFLSFYAFFFLSHVNRRGVVVYATSLTCFVDNDIILKILLLFYLSLYSYLSRRKDKKENFILFVIYETGVRAHLFKYIPLKITTLVQS
jgi:hypothetical protein